MKGEFSMGNRKRLIKLMFCIGLVLIFSLSAATAYAKGLSSKQVAERLQKFKGETLVVVSWGGSFQEAQRKALFKPFAEEFGINVVEDSP
jgi:spermidine/putrescine-binding protein